MNQRQEAASMIDEKIQVQNVSKTFELGGERFEALGDVSLTVRENEFITVVGPSGCGKSTLMNILAGLEEPTSGTAHVDGIEVDGPSPERGVIFQQYALFPWLTVRQNVEFGLKTAKVPAAERRQRAQHFIDMVDLSDFADSLPKTLSGGMKQRCAIARAYAMNPSILLMDEPFGAVDPIVREELQSELQRLQRELRKTIVFVTHDIDEAFRIGDRVAILRPGGRIAQVGTPQEILADPTDDFVASFVGADRGARTLHVEHVDGRDVVVDADGRAAGVLAGADGRLGDGGAADGDAAAGPGAEALATEERPR